ncbi:FAD-binding oxidoreductase [Humibacter sp. RRB41]|uniref:FAD-binding oxidoreductase n=1 Tax=Humibacter sp. RRB41 TaxID=2919946 RepID=UPI001FA9CE95|nr:FAD-binding protein [Humibacter sp. RRB41]
MTDVTPASAEAESLRGLLPGRVFLPGDPGYDEARTPWNTSAQLAPAAVVVPVSVAEVQAVVRTAVSAGLRIAPMSTGHAGALLAASDLSGTVLVRLSGFTGVTVDPEEKIGRVVGGTVWSEVAAAAALFGLAAPHGSAGNVGVVGFTLSGGVSFYGREYGLAVNRVRAVELVTADGIVQRVSSHENADLFWAIRGGNGNFGIVTAIELELLPHSDVYAGMLLWDLDRAPDVMRAWRDFTQNTPKSVTTSFRVMSFPPLPELPPFLAGRNIVVVDGAILETDDRASDLLAPLRALAPEVDTFGRIPAPALLGVHMDPLVPTPSVSDHCMLGELPDGAIDAFLARVGPGTNSGLMIAELRQLGGAFAERVPDGGAISSVDGAYALFAIAVAPTPEAAAYGAEAAAGLRSSLTPWSLPGSLLLTFTEHPVGGADAYGHAGERLADEAVRLDPLQVFTAGHGIR